MARTKPHEVQLRAAEKLGQLREKFLAALYVRFEAGAPLTLDVAREVIAAMQEGDKPRGGAGGGSRLSVS